MPAMQEIGKMLLALGLIIVAVGLVLMFTGKVSFLGRLPGDIRIERENFSCSFPIVTCIIVSLMLTLILNLVMRLFNR